MEREKVYVEVVVKFLKDGGMRPIKIVWQDGRTFEVDRVKFIERASSVVGSLMPVRYVLCVGGREKKLYFEPEEMRWFVEAQKR